MSDALPEDVVFYATIGERSYSSRIVKSPDIIETFLISCTFEGTAVHDVPGGITVYLPVPETALPDIDLLEVQHLTRISPPRIETMPARVENGCLVFETTYI